MKEDLLKIINHYGVMPQLKYFQSEVFELNEAITKYEAIEDWSSEGYFIDVVPNKEHITEEIADVMVMLKQFQLYYGIDSEEIKSTMIFKINRQLERMEEEHE